MSVLIMARVFAQSRATGNDRLVLLAIADRCNDDGTDAWPSIPTLASKVLASERTVQRSIQNLERIGELEVIRSPGGHASNRYRVTLPRGDNLSPRQSVTGDTRVTAEVTPVSSDTSLRPKTPQPPASGGPARRPHCERHRRHDRDCLACRRAAEPPPPTRPPWCGDCDQSTRLIELEEHVIRCPTCHPLTQPKEPHRHA